MSSYVISRNAALVGGCNIVMSYVMLCYVQFGKLDPTDSYGFQRHRLGNRQPESVPLDPLSHDLAVEAAMQSFVSAQSYLG